MSTKRDPNPHRATHAQHPTPHATRPPTSNPTPHRQGGADFAAGSGSDPLSRDSHRPAACCRAGSHPTPRGSLDAFNDLFTAPRPPPAADTPWVVRRHPCRRRVPFSRHPCHIAKLGASSHATLAKLGASSHATLAKLGFSVCPWVAVGSRWCHLSPRGWRWGRGGVTYRPVGGGGVTVESRATLCRACDAAPRRATLSHGVPRCPMACHAVPCVPRCPKAYHAVPWRATLSHGVPRCPNACHAVPMRATLSHGVPRCPKACHAVPRRASLSSIVSLTSGLLDQVSAADQARYADIFAQMDPEDGCVGGQKVRNALWGWGGIRRDRMVSGRVGLGGDGMGAEWSGLG